VTSKILVTNDEPQTTTRVPSALLDLFQEYTRQVYGQPYAPFLHQAQVFRLVGEEDKAVMLVAGTAAGKTLAIGVPLFHKLATGRIKRVLLMYPTIALMNDQRRVMDKLAELTHIQVGHIQGGMQRSALMAALNKPVIVATPDAIYWFFQKNVKYAGLLMYGLSLIDEFVLDEAHLFSGLALRNVLHLKKRITALADNLGRRPHWHILTATPTSELRALAGDAETITGRSKCSDVEVTFSLPVAPKDPQQRNAAFIQAIDEALTAGAGKVLLVLNSAAGAHRLFEEIRGEQPILALDLQLRFGVVLWGELRRWLADDGGTGEIISVIANWVEREGPFHLHDLHAEGQAKIRTEELMAKTSRFLQEVGRRIKDVAYATERETGGHDFIRHMEQQLNERGKAVQALWQLVRTNLPADANSASVKQTLSVSLTALSDTLAQVWDGEELRVTAPHFPELAGALRTAGVPAPLADALSRQLQYNIELDEEAAQHLRKSQATLDRRPVPLRWLGESWLVQDDELRQMLAQRLEGALRESKLTVETRHIATWGDSGVPAVIYTGQMSRRDREGLIETFDQMERAVLVSTPAVEVGVDFKAETLVTEECDGNGFLQRFGRVGRTGHGLAQVIVLLREGETWARLQQRGQPRMSREAFSRMIIDPEAPTDLERSLFPDRTYAAGSVYLDATHWLVNRQLGRIGAKLNEAMFPGPVVADLARQMEETDVPFAYGLRGTLPGISLLGGGGGSPFYVLSKVSDEKLAPSSSPFEVAEAQMGYTRFLYLKGYWHIRVDWSRTVAASRAMFYWLDRRWRIATGYGVAKDYINSFSILRKFGNNLAAMRQQLSRVQNPPLWIQAVARLGEALNLHTTPQSQLILGQGDVFLQRVERESGVSTCVEDRLGNLLILPDQLWLYILGDPDQAWRRLEAAGVSDLSEVHYPQHDEPDMILLDEVAGGCFYIYERLMDDAD
jgi:hypothetical protein